MDRRGEHHGEMWDEQAVIQAFHEVSTSLAALGKLAGSESEQARSVKALEKSVQISNDRYSARGIS